jgi:dihydropteroate synthase
VLAGSWEDRAPPAAREWATAAASALAVAGGADLLRLHDASALQAVRIAAAIAARNGPAQSGGGAIAAPQAAGADHGGDAR